MVSNAHSTPRSANEVLDTAKVRLLAQLKITNLSNEEAAKHLGISIHQVHKLEKTEDFKVAVREITEEMMKTAAMHWKGAMGKLIPKAIKVLEKCLDEGDLEAVKVVIKGFGMDQMETAQANNSLTVVLPDFSRVEKHVDVEVK